MARQETPAEVKQRLIRQLRDSRQALSAAAASARECCDPVALATRSIARHKLAWIAGAAVTGWILVRLVLPAKNRSDISGKSARTRGFSGMLRGVLLTAAQRAAVNYAKDHFQTLQTQFKDSVASLFHRPPPRS